MHENEAILNLFKEQAEHLYLKTLAGGARDPVVIMEDCPPSEITPEMTARAEADDSTPMRVYVVEREEAIRELGANPEAQRLLTQPAPGYPMTVVVLSGETGSVFDCLHPDERYR